MWLPNSLMMNNLPSLNNFLKNPWEAYPNQTLLYHSNSDIGYLISLRKYHGDRENILCCLKNIRLEWA